MLNYKELSVWQEAMKVAEQAYDMVKKFPIYEQYGLMSQIRRSSISIASNIAEGMQRTGKDQLHFLRISSGSACELETQVLLAQRLGYIDTLDNIDFSIELILKMLTGLKKRVKLYAKI